MKKDSPVLTSTYCKALSGIRLAFELSAGKPIRFIHFDLNTNDGRIIVDENHEYDISVTWYENRILTVQAGRSGPYSTVRIASDGLMRVANREQHQESTHKRKPLLSWTGTSLLNRYEVPFDDADFKTLRLVRCQVCNTMRPSAVIGKHELRINNKSIPGVTYINEVTACSSCWEVGYTHLIELPSGHSLLCAGDVPGAILWTTASLGRDAAAQW